MTRASRTLISADWVLPVRAPAVPDGAVLVDGERIVDVGPRVELAARYPDTAAQHHPGCIMTPGLVNAHTHLTLSALAGVVEPQPFAQWLPRLVAALKPWQVADHEASGVIGAEECLRSGVTVVGDIAYGAAEVVSASDAGLGGVYYWELLGMSADQIDTELAALRYPDYPARYGARVVCGLSAHSPYTSGPQLLRAVTERAADLGVPCAIHLAESQAELQLLRDGTGPLAATAQRTALGFSPPGTAPAEYLDALGALDDITAVHLCHITPHEIELLALRARGVVTCPRSNRYLSNPPPAVAPLLAAGLAVGVGTDSSASNRDLDLMEEVRAIALVEKTLSAQQLLELATAGGAKAIGVEHDYGSLALGSFADLALFDVAAGTDPEAAVVARAGRDTVRAVMSGGVWRVRDGVLLETDEDAARRADRARELSLEALAAL